ncbi:MAG: NAD(P)/FAD-dependent oxidoreductase [Burkholderiales bacterium]|jgi:glycerol-3-phosphate dehydrogenase|nr:NAD(P)/FAD-dependent oxidoreductase [Burkholderiales bacterium]
MNPVFDVAVIGGGVVGCAVLRRFALGGLRAVLLERGGDLLSGASKANSALLHTGFDAPPGSLEVACMQAGYREYLAIHERFGLPLMRTGGVVVAWTADEAARLDAIVAQAHANGVADVQRIDLPALYRREPNLAPGATGAVEVPGEHVIDAWSAPLAYALQAIAHGAQVRRRCEVQGGERERDRWVLATSQGPVEAAVVVNCAGLHGDHVERIARTPPFEIRPRKGQFVVFDKPAFDLVQSIVLPVPTERTKGVVVCRTAYGNLLVGPTAEEQSDRDHASVDHDALEALIAKGRALVPALADHGVNAVYAGLRPATERKEYRIEALPDRGWIGVGGIRSTGLTAALGIAQHVAALHVDHFGPLRGDVEPIWTPVPNLCEARPRRWQQADPGEIVCHCELVTAHEIDAALSGPLPAGDLGGLKRRTRCMMGRCQGFYCTWRVMQLAAGRLPDGPTVALAA